ncbi:SDR family NAD(P)-dependent oxidoreductase [Brachybacterium hainanense]|uniref:SDR family NAD(P)-dependent oxidoreductase n=1 Tax=Brachybacterium hainanense TaxID=1541174 RepID=A0ABV6RDZ3_9MICO
MTLNHVFTGKVAQVTGAGAGMGLPAAQAFAAAGASTPSSTRTPTQHGPRPTSWSQPLNSSSNAGPEPGPTRSAHVAAKHAVTALATSAALGEGHHGIRVNAVCPSIIQAPMVERMVAAGELDKDAMAQGTAIGRIGLASEVTDAVLWLSRPAPASVTGVALPVDGGLAAG